MPKIRYQLLNLSRKTLKTIATADNIIAEYARQGYDLTLRQLYYQFVARGLVNNDQNEYKKLGEAVSAGRLAGLLDWYAITDWTRNLRSDSFWDSPQSILESCVSSFEQDLWQSQKFRVEVWIEKDSLIGVLQSVCPRLRVPYFSCRGYVSQSEMWAAAMRLTEYEKAGKKTVLLHLGDHDPSGVDMSRDIAARLLMFNSKVDVQRIALTMAQVDALKPPPNPAKMTDSRSADYVNLYGEESWELDALDPKTLVALVEEWVAKYRNDKIWRLAKEEEEGHRGQLKAAALAWDKIAAKLKPDLDVLNEETDIRSCPARTSKTGPSA